ncbi:leucine-rich repeat domain-containing protein [Marnyiella aurantia]|uniref:Leucine-rich repeat domain-containing protein n=1 Tax=Marnyiella aurantia TaxID=2758037 RepID=A0A7D7QV64_9FLAO|nr:leucine-rich repeat domain-containing protein [Marnyiella aurantia]MBA5247905.1 leucine-rich repeat domain-containing protein [Marnyiella aurantia]QMS99527.1 leucine-rich repeat domain-containing protein [Marnyiella aurantia]
MKKFLSLTLFSFFILNCNAQKMYIKDNNLKRALIEQIDKNSNGEIEESEVLETKKLRLDEKNISDISGLEKFKNLTYLNLRKNQISDFSKLNKLESLEELIIGDNKNVEKLNLKNLNNLVGLYAFRLGLKEIKLNSSKIKNLYLQDNEFLKFETKKFPELYTLNLDGCKQLTELDLTQNPNLGQIYLLNTAIKKLNVAGNPVLKTMYIENEVELLKNKNQERLKPAPIIIQN